MPRHTFTASECKRGGQKAGKVMRYKRTPDFIRGYRSGWRARDRKAKADA